MKEFSGQTVLWLRCMYAVSVIPATLLVAFLPLPSRLLSASQRTFDLLYSVLFISSRVFVFSLIFFVLHIAPRGDVVGYYYTEANRALHGALVYRDFTSSYAPLFSYIGAAILRIKNSPLALIVFTILVETCSVPIWFAAIRSSSPEPVFRRGALLYLVQPLMLFNVAIDGGNNAWIALTLALALLCFTRRRDAAFGASYSISLIAVKFLPLIFAPLLFLSARRRLAWTAGFLLPVLAVFSMFAAKHADIFQPFRQEGNAQLGGSLPLLFSYATGNDIPGRIADGITVFVLLGCTLAWWRIIRTRDIVGAWAIALGLLAVTLSMLMFSKKS
ncbi:MAG: glycosyltransferase 87 family protein, partial [Acidobacteriaceae bacterium]